MAKIEKNRKYWQNYGITVMGDNPIAWNAAKERRKEEKQRKAAVRQLSAKNFGYNVVA